MPTDLQQVAGYVLPATKDELIDMAVNNRGLSISLLIAEALDIALPELRKKHGDFRKPNQAKPHRRKAS